MTFFLKYVATVRCGEFSKSNLRPEQPENKEQTDFLRTSPFKRSFFQTGQKPKGATVAPLWHHWKGEGALQGRRNRYLYMYMHMYNMYTCTCTCPCTTCTCTCTLAQTCYASRVPSIFFSGYSSWTIYIPQHIPAYITTFHLIYLSRDSLSVHGSVCGIAKPV